MNGRKLYMFKENGIRYSSTLLKRASTYFTKNIPRARTSKYWEYFGTPNSQCFTNVRM